MANLRTYIAGLGTTAALVLSAVLAFVAVGTVVGVDSLPANAGGSELGTLVVRSNAPEAAAVSVASATSAPAPTPAAAATAASPDAAAPGAPGPTAAPSQAPTGPAIPALEPPDVPGPVDPGAPDPDPEPPAPPPTPPAPGPGSGNGLTGGLAGALDDTVTGVTGIDLDLGGKTAPLTNIVDGLTDGLGLTNP